MLMIIVMSCGRDVILLILSHSVKICHYGILVIVMILRDSRQKMVDISRAILCLS